MSDVVLPSKFSSLLFGGSLKCSQHSLFNLLFLKQFFLCTPLLDNPILPYCQSFFIFGTCSLLAFFLRRRFCSRFGWRSSGKRSICNQVGRINSCSRGIFFRFTNGNSFHSRFLVFLLGDFRNSFFRFIISIMLRFIIFVILRRCSRRGLDDNFLGSLRSLLLSFRCGTGASILSSSKFSSFGSLSLFSSYPSCLNHFRKILRSFQG